jgi:hypothetical protein
MKVKKQDLEFEAKKLKEEWEISKKKNMEQTDNEIALLQ